jgi:hypothetical protein
MLALGLDGLALVTQGEVEEGVRLLDEATAAAASGELTDPMAIENVCCYLIYACKRVRDLDRAGQWCERVKEIAERWSDRQLFATCRVHYADVLVWRGAWAESELELAAREFGVAGPHKVADAAVRLAELWRRQGRLGEAEDLLRDTDRHLLAPLVRSALALDRGDAEQGRDLAERYLRRIPADERTERVPGLELAARALLALADREAAAGVVCAGSGARRTRLRNRRRGAAPPLGAELRRVASATASRTLVASPARRVSGSPRAWTARPPLPARRRPRSSRGRRPSRFLRVRGPRRPDPAGAGAGWPGQAPPRAVRPAVPGPEAGPAG